MSYPKMPIGETPENKALVLVKSIVEKIAKTSDSFVSIYDWERSFVIEASKEDNIYLNMIAGCVINGSAFGDNKEEKEKSIVSWNRAQVQLGRIDDFDDNTLKVYIKYYLNELYKFKSTLETKKKVQAKKEELINREFNDTPLGHRFPEETGKRHAGRQGLAGPNGWHLSGKNLDDEYLIVSIYNSTLEQILTVYSAAGIEEFKKDVDLMNVVNLLSLVAKLTDSEEPFARELKDICVEKIKNNPDSISYIVERGIIPNLIRGLHLSIHKKDENGNFIKDRNGIIAYFSMPEEDKGDYLNEIKATIELYSIQPEQILKQILYHILDHKEGRGIQYMNSGTAKYDVERFNKVIGYLEKVTGYTVDIKKINEAILEKAISKYLPKDGLYGLPLTEDVNYLAGLPEYLNLNVEELDFVKKHGEAGKFNLVIITNLYRSINTGGGILGGYNYKNMTKFCQIYRNYINFKDSDINFLISTLKQRDETGELNNHSAEEILCNEKLGEMLYAQVGKYNSSAGAPGDQELLQSVERLSGKKLEDI